MEDRTGNAHPFAEPRCRVRLQKHRHKNGLKNGSPGLSPRDVALENIVMMTGLGRYDDVRQLLTDVHPADIAELLDQLDEPRVRQRVFGLLLPEAASAVLSLISPAVRDELVTNLSDRELAGLVEELDTDDAADLLETLPEERTPTVLAEMPSELAEEIGDLLDHPPDTAGGIMQTEYVSVPQYATVEQAIGLIRRAQDDVPEVHDVFVMNVERHVTGILPLSNLVLARPDESVANIMERPVISVPVEMPQDEVARVLQKYDLVTVPVVDEKGRLAGRVTIDDVVDVIEEEASKDIYAIAGVNEGESIDLEHDSVLKRVGERFSWVLTTVVLGLVVALVISKVFVTTFEKMALLAAFLPVIIATAGAVGLQSSTLVVRAIALGTLSFQHILSVIAHEAATGLVLGVSCGLITAVASYLINMGTPDILNLSLAVLIGMVISVTTAACVGTVQPIIFYRLKRDPAVAAGPLVTAFNDLLGTTMYLVVATALQTRCSLVVATALQA